MKNEVYSDGMNFANWVEPSPLPSAQPYDDVVEKVAKEQIQPQTHTPPEHVREQRHELRDEHKPKQEPHHEHKKESGLDLMSLLPLLTSMGGGGKPTDKQQMDMIMKLLKSSGVGGKGGSDLMSMIPTLMPLLMNSGLLSPKKKDIPHDKIINLDDYKRID